MSDYVTTGDIARKLGRPLSRVTYAIQRLGIVEDARAGTYRLFRVDRLESIIEQVRTVGNGGSTPAGARK